MLAFSGCRGRVPAAAHTENSRVARMRRAAKEMQNRRPAAVAGSWYPASADALAAAVDRHLAAAEEPGLQLTELVALIAPHAGLTYSGPVAAHAYRQLRGRSVDLAVLVGPSHFVAFEGVAVYPRGAFDTPLGPVEVDEECAARLIAATPTVREYPAAHGREHSLEMQLPFLKRVAPPAKVVPLVMGVQRAETVRALGDALGLVLRDRRALLVASTDLSHYHDALVAARLDAIVIDCVSRFDADALQEALDRQPDLACGGGPTVAVMRAARHLGASRALVLKYADSGDVSGDKSSVVGYLAAAIGTDRKL
jgi:AmmeMemoRadiSam system protein B